MNNFCYISSFCQGGADCYASLNIRIIDYYVQQPSYCADNPDDFWGYTEVEWEVESVDVFLEETSEPLYSWSSADHKSLDYYGTTFEEIEEWLLEQIEGMEEVYEHEY